MNDAVRRLRAQKSYSTDPDYLERMACAAESRGADPTHNASAEPGSRSNLSSNRASAGSTPAGLKQLVKSDEKAGLLVMHIDELQVMLTAKGLEVARPRR